MEETAAMRNALTGDKRINQDRLKSSCIDIFFVDDSDMVANRSWLRNKLEETLGTTMRNSNLLKR